jgi:hypothetical protein
MTMLTLIAFDAGDKLNSVFMDRWLVFAGLAAMGVLGIISVVVTIRREMSRVRRRRTEALEALRDAARATRATSHEGQDTPTHQGGAFFESRKRRLAAEAKQQDRSPPGAQSPFR